MMPEDITLLVPTHQRHHYLDRLLSFYKEAAVKIVVADSSAHKYTLPFESGNISYYHLPGVGLPQKLSMVLKKITTTFIVICADDDFVIPNGVRACVDFLKSDRTYSVAQGNSICYYKDAMNASHVKFFSMYTGQLSFEIASDAALKRIEDLFTPYRTIFCAVHYTKNIQRAYNETITVNNLFLYEYLSGIIPLSAGKHKELNVFFQVRENAHDSGDKYADNLDVILNSPVYKKEYSEYLSYISGLIAAENGLDQTDVLQKMDLILKEYSLRLKADHVKASTDTGWKKKIGNLIAMLPVIGRKIVLSNRESERKRNLEKIIKNEDERNDLLMVENKIKEYAAVIS